jgi:hypothetical protein
MDHPTFWKIIKRAAGEAEGDPQAFAEAVYAQLAELPPPQIEGFDAVLWAKLAAAYDWKLWGAAYLINGGCSDDGFLYFRCWLISQGQKVFEAALANPDTLAKAVDPDDDEHECEDLLGVAARAYEEVTGNPFPTPEGPPLHPSEPTGERWDFDDADATAERLPRLARKYEEC